MRALLSHFIQHQHAAGNERGQFRAAGLFIDLSGFTAMTESLMQHGTNGAEALVAVMQAIFGALVDCVYIQGGFVARTAGDAFTALFPLEEETQDAAARALAAAVCMQQHMASHPLQRTPYGEFAVSARVGLSLGEVGWGIVHSADGQRAAYYFQGSAIDGCAAAEHAAAPGDIVAEPEFRAAIRNSNFEIVGHHFRLVGEPTGLPAPQPIDLPLPDEQVMRRFFPELLINQPHSGEFRHIVSLFISLPTVRNKAQLASFMTTVFELQEQYGGLISSLDFGDKGSNLLLFWGAPVTLENDPERALSFILDLQSLTSIPINAGVTYHMAYAGFLGAECLDEYNCYGRGINLAARLMTSAPRGEIWVSEQIVRLAQAHFDFEPAGEMVFKGFSAKQPVFLLLERKVQRQSFYSGRLVGRAAELARLEAWVEPLWQGQAAGALVVLGEAGIGKSRLLHEFMTSPLFEQHPALWAVCQTSEIYRDPFNPFRYWLRGYLEQSEGQNERLNKRSFNRVLDALIEFATGHDPTLADELDRTRTFLGALVDLRWPDSLYEQMDPEARYQNTLLALIFLLQAESLRQPVVLFVEDAHWLDEDTRRFLPRLQRALTCDDCQVYPLALLATARDDETPALLGEGLEFQEIALAGITREQVTDLADCLLDAPADSRLLALLAERAEGNPLFAEQILRYLQEQSLLAWDGEAWGLAADPGDLSLPTDIGAVLVARLDRLAQEVRRVVQTAAVLGREFELLLLRRMLLDDELLQQKVQDAGQAAIWSALDEYRYLFRHALLREAAYRMQVSAQRRGLHALAAQAIEDLHAGDLSPHYGELAYHHAAAAQVEQARKYYILAGDIARQAYQNAQALDFYSRALELTPAEDPEARFDLLVNRTQLYWLIGEQKQQEQNLRLLDDVIGAADEFPARRARVFELWSAYWIQQQNYPSAVAAAEQSIAAGQAAGEVSSQVEAFINQSYALYRLGKFTESLALNAEGLELARRHGDKIGEQRSLNSMGLTYYELGDMEAAGNYLDASLQIARQLVFHNGQAMALTNLSMIRLSKGDFLTGMAYLQEALQIVEMIGNRPKEVQILVNLGFSAGQLGDFATARRHSERAIRIVKELGDKSGEAFLRVNLSSYANRLGDHQGAQSNARQGLSVARQVGDPSLLAWALLYLGTADLELGELAEAQASYQEALEVRRRLNQPNLACEPLAGLARWALLQGDTRQAEAYANEILVYLDNGGTLDGADEPLRVYLSCVQVLQAAGDPRARHILATAHGILHEQAARIEDETLHSSFLQDIPYHREILRLWES
jgi:predicted ATPase/class 3 adenylate cyclase